MKLVCQSLLSLVAESADFVSKDGPAATVRSVAPGWAVTIRGAIGEYQVNVAPVKGGAVPVTIQIGGVISNTVTIAVQ